MARNGLYEAANVKSAAGFLQALIEAVPYTIHIVLTDNGIQFGDMPSRRTGPTARYRLHMSTASAASMVSSTPHQAEPSLDQRSGRADEPHHQGSHRSALSLRDPPAAPRAPRSLPQCLQLR